MSMQGPKESAWYSLEYFPEVGADKKVFLDNIFLRWTELNTAIQSGILRKDVSGADDLAKSLMQKVENFLLLNRSRIKKS